MRPIDGDRLKKAIAELHLFEDEQTIRNYYRENYGYSLATDFTETLVEVFDVIDDAPTIEPSEWIPCSERLPNEKEIVLITNDKGNVRFGQFRGTHGKYWIWKGNTLETVLAWMPLPKPWKGADDE